MSTMAPLADVCGLPAAGLYTDPAFLEVVAHVYHPGRRCTVRDHRVGDHVFRLLDVEGHGPLVSQTFIDFHEPLGPWSDASGRLPGLPRLPGVAGPPQPVDAFRMTAGRGLGDGAPLARWREFGSWDSYLALLQSRKVLSDDRRRRRKLAAWAGELVFQAHDPASDVLPTCFAWKSARDRSLGRPALFDDPRHGRFFEELQARGMLRASTLRGGDGLLAIWLGALHAGRWSGWVFTFNPAPELARFSPGRQLLYDMLEHGFRSGHAEFDFSIGLEPYKLQFATHVRPIGLCGRPTALSWMGTAARATLARYPRLHERVRAVRQQVVAVRHGGRAVDREGT